jgi:hypothetical protein
VTRRPHGPAIPLGVILAVLLPGPLCAQSQPHIEVDMSLFGASNPFLRPGEEALTLGGQIAGKAEAIWALDHRTNLETDGSLTYRQYAREYGEFLSGSLELALAHRRNEYLSFRTEASFERILPIEALASSLDGAIDPISLQDRYEISQALTYNTSTLTTFNGRVGWNRIAPRRSLLLAPTSAVFFDFGAERRIDPATTLGFAGQLLASRSRTGGDPRTWAFAARATRRFPKAWNLVVEAGATRISRLEPAGGRQAGPVQFSGNVGICHEPGHIRFCASGAVASIVTSFGGIQREVFASTSLDWRTSERGTVLSRGEYRRSPQGIARPDLEVLTLDARYEHRLDGRFTVYGGAEYQQRTGLGTDRLHAMTVRAGLIYRIPRR